MEYVVQSESRQEVMPESMHILELPLAKLQIVQSGEIIRTDYLDRVQLEPTLSCNADGLWLLNVRRQGEHRKFDVPYIGTEIILADAELGLVVVLVGYHGSSTEKYGKLGYMTQKGQFYRYYQQQPSGEWQQIKWVQLTDEWRSHILSAVEEHGPEWARKPGKLRSERKPPTKHVTMTTYKVVRVIDGRYFSLYDPTQEYVLGERVKEPVKKHYGGGFFSYPTQKQGEEYLDYCAKSIPFHPEVATPALAFLEVEIGGKMIDYGHKFCSTYLKPMRVLEIRALSN